MALTNYLRSVTLSSTRIICTASQLHVYDLRKEVGVFNDATNCGQWCIGLLEEKDLNRAVDISMNGFFRPKLTLDGEGMGSVEKHLARNVIGLFTGFEEREAKFSNYIGFKTRSDRRLLHPNLELSKYSLILAVCDMATDEIVGIVEISLEKPNGMFATPLQSPFKRKPHENDMPYLCNLSVDSKYRRRGLGKLLCKTCECIVTRFWDRNTIYLHVEANNIPARRLYDNMGYVPSPIQVPIWQRQIKGIDRNVLYFKKDLEGESST